MRHHRGDIDKASGRMFWQYSGVYENWVTPEHFERKRHSANSVWMACRARNLDTFNARDAKYKASHKDEIRERKNAYSMRRRNESASYRIRHNLRGRMWRALNGRCKLGDTMELLGCSMLDLKSHLEHYFLDGMSWNNYGNRPGCWSIDHTIPCSAYDLSDKSQQSMCFRYTNLRPMWHSDNLSKSDSFTGIPPYLFA